MDPSRKVPTLADLEALPPGVKGEIIDGVMYTMTRPRGPHQRMERVVSSRIGDPFDDGRDGPGGASVGVPHHWLVDLEAKMVTAYRLERALWVELGSWGDERDARIEPFEAIALDVGSWWT